MIVYIDSDFKCHTKPQVGLRSVEASCADDKCAFVIERYRFIPSGETWIREDGRCFTGEMWSPFGDVPQMIAAQTQYTEDCDNMMSLADVADIVELVYEDDLGIIG